MWILWHENGHIFWFTHFYIIIVFTNEMKVFKEMQFVSIGTFFPLKLLNDPIHWVGFCEFFTKLADSVHFPQKVKTWASQNSKWIHSLQVCFLMSKTLGNNFSNYEKL